jgi:NAD(P)-dependent dehydrogenase (short-subunit alcohol dehydrogenase family)
MSSVHGFLGSPGHSVYAGTKGAINAFSRELAVELCPLHIRVNVLAPGTIEVLSYWRANPDYNRELGNSLVPWGRVGLPEDVGYLAAYLISDASEFMTGQVIYFDGGLTAKMALPVQPPTGER